MEPEALYCQKEYVLQCGVEDGFRLTLMYPGGFSAYIEVGTCNFIALPRFYLCGRDGAAIIGDWREPCRVTRCTSWSGDSTAHSVPNSTGVMSDRDETSVRSFTLPPQPVDRFEFLRNFCAAVRGEETLHVTRRQAMRVMRILEAAAASAALGQPVRLEQEAEGDQ